jgi:hypothetical protein
MAFYCNIVNYIKKEVNNIHILLIFNGIQTKMLHMLLEKRNIAEHHLVKNFEIKVLIAACYVSTRSSLHPIPNPHSAATLVAK